MASYELLKTLDRGGMAEVFLARLVGVQGFEKRVVLKRVLPHLSKEPRFVERFLDEARLAAQLSHPHIVPIFELGEERGQYFIAMEYVEGKNLREVLKRLKERGRTLPRPMGIKIMAQLLDALGYAHTRKDPSGRPLQIVHRDVSPSNVLLSWEGGVKLIDFGIAKAADIMGHTRPGAVVGKAGYMAPEQCRGEPVDARTDLYVAGALLYRLLLGDIPFEGTSELAVMAAIAEGRVRDPLDRDPELDPDVAAVLRRALAVRPADRFPDARSFQTELEALLARKGWITTTADLAELLEELYDTERAFAAVPDRRGETDEGTASRVVTLIASLPTLTEESAGDVEDVGAMATVHEPAPEEDADKTSDSEPSAQPPAGAAADPPHAGASASATQTLIVAGPPLAVDDATRILSPGSTEEAARPGRGLLLVAAAAAGVIGLAAVAWVAATAPAGPTTGVAAVEDANEGPEPRDPSPPTSASPIPAPTPPVHADDEDAPAATDEGREDAARRPPLEVQDGEATPTAPAPSPRPGAQEAAGSNEPATRPPPSRPGGRRRARPAPKLRSGLLQVNTLPWSEVFLDGRKVGVTPILALKVTEGEHELLLVNKKEKLRRKVRVTIRPDRTERVALKLKE